MSEAEHPSQAPPTRVPLSVEASTEPAAIRRVALLGNPNTGKTTLFNRLSGLRHKTSNFPGTTLEARVARVKAGSEGGVDAELVDLPGIYSLELDQLEARVTREVLAGQAAPRGEALSAPEVVVVVADATNLARNLMLVGEVFRRRLPTVVVVNMIDLAERAKIVIDAERLAAALGCGVVLTSARSGAGIDRLRSAIKDAVIPSPSVPLASSASGLRSWAEEMYAIATHASDVRMNAGGTLADQTIASGHAQSGAIDIPETLSDRVDRVLLHPVSGTLTFAIIMTGLFYTLFSLAKFPMEWIGAIFDVGKSLVQAHLPEGPIRDLIADGVVGGVGSTLVFLPQICLLFFLISLLEDTGYLARGALLMDRLLRPFGLPGHSFVPLLSSHACALPGIMSARAIPDVRERLATILVAPFMTCSARLPVYVLLTTLLFKDRPALGALAFVGCYALGMGAGVLSALVARRTVLRGKSRAMAMELPTYKWPSVRSAFIGTYQRGLTFLKNAGTNILVICLVLWWLGAYPRVEPPAQAIAMRASAEKLRASAPASAAELESGADHLETRHAKASSFLGQIGKAIQPVFQPLGYDWQLTVGVLASFAAREVFVSTMNVVVAGQEHAEDDEGGSQLMRQIQESTRDDGVTRVFTRATSWSLLVFFVLAMQCLPTLAVTARESGSVKWALLQLAWMSGMAYVASMIVYQVLR